MYARNTKTKLRTNKDHLLRMLLWCEWLFLHIKSATYYNNILYIYLFCYHVFCKSDQRDRVAKDNAYYVQRASWLHARAAAAAALVRRMRLESSAACSKDAVNLPTETARTRAASFRCGDARDTRRGTKWVSLAVRSDWTSHHQWGRITVTFVERSGCIHWINTRTCIIWTTG